MNTQIFSRTAALYRQQNVKNVFQFIRKKFSTNTLMRKKKVDAGPRIIVPMNCKFEEKPISQPCCKVAVVIGGTSNGFGYTAAEQLLSFGAKRVILADRLMDSGAFAAEKLCKAFGKDRARFYYCDLKNTCQIEGIYTTPLCRDEMVSVLFHDLDAIYNLAHSNYNYCIDEEPMTNVRRLTKLAMEHLARGPRLPGGKIVINCASLFGFMGWPKEPEPVYCNPEPAIETTIETAKAYPANESGIRVVALCPSSRVYEDIGLPDFPDEDAERIHRIDSLLCQPYACCPDPTKDKLRFGKAIATVMAKAESGSTWLVEPPFTLREAPRLIHVALKGSPTDENTDSPKVDCPHGLPVRGKSEPQQSCQCK